MTAHHKRTLLVGVTDDPHSRLMFAWLLDGALRPTDQLHILHVAVAEHTDAALPGGDYFEQAHPVAARQVVHEMLLSQFVAPLRAAFPAMQPSLHIVQASQDCKTVGRIICEKAQQFQAEQVIIGGSGGHHRSIVAGALLGSSVVAYVKQHCKVPVTVVVPEEQQGGAAGKPARS